MQEPLRSARVFVKHFSTRHFTTAQTSNQNQMQNEQTVQLRKPSLQCSSPAWQELLASSELSGPRSLVELKRLVLYHPILPLCESWTLSKFWIQRWQNVHETTKIYEDLSRSIKIRQVTEVFRSVQTVFRLSLSSIRRLISSLVCRSLLRACPGSTSQRVDSRDMRKLPAARPACPQATPGPVKYPLRNIQRSKTCHANPRQNGNG